MPQQAAELIDCDEVAHGAAILAIFNHAIAHTTALYEYQPRTPAFMQQWFAAKRAGGWPVLGLLAADGQLLGFASWGPFRAFPAYKYTLEHSVYIHPEHHGRGLGRRLLAALIERAAQSQVHALIGCIDAANVGSLRLHQALGFQHIGTFPEVGFKFGRWLDAAFYQLQLPLTAPVDD